VQYKKYFRTGNRVGTGDQLKVNGSRRKNCARKKRMGKEMKR